MKKLITLVLALACLFSLVSCGANKYTCRPLDGDEIVDLQPSSPDEPFVTDEERDDLLNKAIRKYLDDFDHKSDSFTYEITGTTLGVYEGRETLLCWVKIVYGEGFTTVLGFIIQ
ncbi:MAG: hypothetical protein II276_03090 [Bacteroidales bacterium]|nr:hypothetical protein [Bacteroidales bacterium]